MTRGVIQGAGLHGGEPVGRGRAGEGVAAAFVGGHPGELGVVEEFFGFADADRAPAFYPGVPLDRGRVPEDHPALYQVFDIAVLWKPGSQATVRAEITETTPQAVPGIVDPSQDRYDDTGTGQPAPRGI
jgi:hypothetical protein